MVLAASTLRTAIAIGGVAVAIALFVAIQVLRKR